MSEQPFYLLRRSETDVYIIRFDGAFVPEDESNSDYCRYLAWLADGNEPEPWNPEAV